VNNADGVSPMKSNAVPRYTNSTSRSGPLRAQFVDAGMLYVQGGTFRMGSDRHYPEEAPAHCVTVDGFWIDRMPITNRQFKKFVQATGHVTFAEIPPDPEDYPGAQPHMLYAGSLVFYRRDAR
jgi:sulfatase modifying factor 1